MTEVGRKLEKIRELLRREEARALRLRGVDWFAWATGGGDSSINLNAEVGVAEVLVTKDRAFVLTREPERERLEIEEVPREFEVVSFPWAQEGAFEDFLASEIGAELEGVFADRPTAGERTLTDDWFHLKRHLSSREIARYQELGLDAARAVTSVLKGIDPGDSERDVAGNAARALWAKGIQPLILLVGGESRMARHRDPVATSARIGERAMLSICGRRHGLCASLTRFVYFRPPSSEERERMHHVTAIEAEAFAATEDLRPLPDVFRRIKARYTALGYPDAVEKHHQGGPTGYLPREVIARPQGTLGFRMEENTAFAWNPNLPGARIEDTVILASDHRVFVLTLDQEWPQLEYAGRKRPDILMRV